MRWAGFVLLVAMGCGPAWDDGPAIAMRRPLPDSSTYSSRIMLVDYEGRELYGVPFARPNESPSGPPYYQHWVGWRDSGPDFYVIDGRLYLVEAGGPRDTGCSTALDRCMGYEDDTWISPSGRILVVQERSEPGIGSYAVSSHLYWVDPTDGEREALSESTQHGCIAIGTGDIVVASAFAVTGYDDTGAPMWHSTVQMFRDGTRTVLDNSAEGSCVWLAPTGDRILWPARMDDRPETTIRDLDGDVVHVIDASGAGGWSPDGRFVWGRDEEGVWIFEADAGRFTRVAAVSGLTDVWWAPSSGRFAIAERCPRETPDAMTEVDHAIFDVDPVPTEILRTGCQDRMFREWAQHGDAFVLSRREDDVRGFRVLTLPGGAEGPFVEGDALAFRP